MQFDTFSSINSIIEHDRVDGVYKYFLLKSAIESCQEYPQYAKINSEDNRVTLPTGLCVIKWMIDFYPLFAHHTFVVLGNNDSPTKRKLAIRPFFEDVCSYYEQHGGVSVFYNDLKYGRLPDVVRNEVCALSMKIEEVLSSLPMQHIGFSQSGRHYSVFRIEEKRTFNKRKTPADFSVKTIIEEYGTYSISRDLYMVFRDLGSFILGTGTVSQKIQETLYAKNSDIPKDEIDTLLSIIPVSERDTEDARKAYKKAIREGRSVCVWGNGNLTESTLVVDHLIPFAVWKSNDLWNLVPATQEENSKKSDKIPSISRLERKKEAIFQCWDLLSAAYPHEFNRGLTVGLLGEEPDEDWKEKAFERLCAISRYLIESRGYEEWK